MIICAIGGDGNSSSSHAARGARIVAQRFTATSAAATASTSELLRLVTLCA